MTGDVQNAGTDTKIYMSVFGANGSTEEMLLQKNEDRLTQSNQTKDEVEKLQVLNFVFFLSGGLQVRAWSGGHL